MSEEKENTSTELTSRERNEEKSTRPFREPTKHNRLQRKAGHDYSAPGMYLITVTTANRERILGRLVSDALDQARVEESPLGSFVVQAFRRMAAKVTKEAGSRVQVIQYQVMPDHFHGILYIRDALPIGWRLGRMISGWKGECSRFYWSILSSPSFPASSLRSSDVSSRPSLFSPGFNDRILYSDGQLKRWISYLRDNPRRLWMKLHHPERLHKHYDFEAGEPLHRYTAIGDTSIVQYPERVQVRCHRNLTPVEIDNEVQRYMALAREGVVLVSPFISPAEKAVYDACYKEQMPMIRIIGRGLDGQFNYPSGRDFQGCVDGFLLVMAPYLDYSPETSAVRISRAQCLDMNAYASSLATIDVSSR